jgi:tetratricopeptide (TPR) repeat protein
MARLGIDDERFDAMADRAARHARGATGGDIQAADLWRQLAQALVESGHPAAAGRALRARLLADTPLEPPALTLLTVVTLVTDAAAGDEEASMELIQGMAMRGKLPDLWGRGGEADLAEVYFDTSTIFSTVGDQAGCERLLRETVRLAPDHAMALNNLGYTRLELGYGDEQTRQWINRAYELAPNDSNVLDTVGWLNYKSGRFGGPQDEAGALALIRESLAQSQEPSAEVLDHLGDTLWRLGDADAALEAWRRAAEVVTDARQRRQMEDLYTALQARQWGLRVADPADLYDLQFGEILERALRKIDAADGGADPPVAATFEEMGVTGPKGGSRDGRP